LQVLNTVIGLLKGLGSNRLVRRVKTLLKQQLNVQLPPEKLFGGSPGEEPVPPEKIFLVTSRADSRLAVEPIDPHDIANRMVFSLQEERVGFLSYYWKYRFAFPDCANPLIDQSEEIQRRILLKLFEGKEAYAVYHPYPFSIPALFEVIRPYCA
jgi:hypothetical protein